MAYDPVTPVTLSNFLTAIGSTSTPTPHVGEAANQLGAIDRQTRLFFYQLLLTIMDPATNKLLVAAITDGSITAAKLAATAVVNANVSASAAIAESKLALNFATHANTNDPTTNQKAALDAATGATGANPVVLANNAALTDTRTPTDSTVTNAKVATGAAIATAKLAPGTSEADILVAAAGTKAWTSVAMSGDATLSSTGVLSLVSRGIALVVERLSNATPAGASAAGSQYRGNLVEVSDTSNLVVVSGGNVMTLVAGTYLIEATVPGYAVGAHVAVIERYNSGNTLQETFVGLGAVAPATVQNHSVVKAYVTCASNDYLKVKHYTTNAVTTNGLGVPMSVSLAYEYYTTIQIQKIAA